MESQSSPQVFPVTMLMICGRYKDDLCYEHILMNIFSALERSMRDKLGCIINNSDRICIRSDGWSRASNKKQIARENSFLRHLKIDATLLVIARQFHVSRSPKFNDSPATSEPIMIINGTSKSYFYFLFISSLRSFINFVYHIS
jgi:hypothetical protein